MDSETKSPETVYRVRLKTRSEMRRGIPDGQRGWWFDVCPGGILMVRDAKEEDLLRCNVPVGSKAADYLCEIIEHGSLVHRDAVKSMERIDKNQ